MQKNIFINVIDSIISQTFIDFELLLIDDGSKDKSGVICDEYAQKDSLYEYSIKRMEESVLQKIVVLITRKVIGSHSWIAMISSPTMLCKT